jgi:hypothetical protein
MQLLIFRPIVTFVENDFTTKHNTIEMWREVQIKLTKLSTYDGEDWDDHENGEEGGLPWITEGDASAFEEGDADTDKYYHVAILQVALHARVIGETVVPVGKFRIRNGVRVPVKERKRPTRERHTLQKRKEGLKIVLRECDPTRQKMANRYLRAMAMAALERFNYHNSEEFNGSILHNLAGGGTARSRALLAASKVTQATSKGVETAFGVASYIQSLFENMHSKQRHDIVCIWDELVSY